MLKIDKLSCSYGGANVVNDVSFDLKPGESLAIIGRNGIGKSTILKALIGLSPFEGLIFENGDKIVGTLDERVRNYGFSYLPQENRIARSLSVKSNLLVSTIGRKKHFRNILSDWMVLGNGGTSQTKEQPWLALQSIREFILPLLDVSGDKLSGGEETLVGFVCTVLACKKYLFLDEPSAGTSKELTSILAKIISLLVSSGGYSALLIEQDPDFISNVTNRVLLVRELNVNNGAIAQEVPKALFHKYQYLKNKPLDLISWLETRL